MKKQFLRVKQIADQTFLRAEKTEVLTEDLLVAEKRVESIKASCQTIHKKIAACQIDFGSETSIEKRLKKIPQVSLGASMLETGNSFLKNSVLGDTLKDCANIQARLGTDILEYNTEVEKLVLKPISAILDNEVHNINKLRKQLGKLVLDMDSARTRFQTAERHSLQASCNTNINVVGKMDTLKEELEDASQKVEQCRDTLAAEMFSLISKEAQLSQVLVQLHQSQVAFHKNALAALETSLPSLESLIYNFPQKPIYGCPLEEHLRVTNRDIALVIEICVSFLLEYGISEEGLLRIAGSSTKLKKIKSAFDAGIDLDLTEFVRDPHAISGALKSYLRELPEPLMTFSLYNEWMNAIKIPDSDAKLQALWQVLHKLPPANFKNLRYVIKFLSKLHENVDVNKMSSQNIAIVMAPNLVWSPSEDVTTLGLNMSTTSLHTSIIDFLISYEDWFFPETSEGDASSFPSSNENNKLTDSVVEAHISENVTELNGNNLQISNSITTETPSSPRSPHKGMKKPAAPLPPVQNNMFTEMHSSEDLISLSKEPATLSPISKESTDLVCARPLKDTSDNCPDSLVTELNSVAKELNSVRNEKPAVPDKPGYGSLSLDRRSFRHPPNAKGSKAAGANRASDILPRTHIERPSVPPPERPTKPKFCSSTENVSEQSKISFESSDNVLNSYQCSSDQEEHLKTEPVIDASKIDKCQNVSQHTRSLSKGNRFDFLVNQKDDKPPERPPRSAIAVETNLKSEIVHYQQMTNNPSVPPPVAPRTVEVEKVKPARPQPPLPTKPKFPLQSENTSL